MLKEVRIRKNHSLIENGIQAEIRKVMNESFGAVRRSSSIGNHEYQDKLTPPNIKAYKPPP